MAYKFVQDGNFVNFFDQSQHVIRLHNTSRAVITIWGGLVWESVTGDTGTADSDIALDAVNWVVVPKASFASNEYAELPYLKLKKYYYETT